MQSIQTSHTFPLSQVKPLDALLRYREHCVAVVRKACAESVTRRHMSPVSGAALAPWGDVDGLEYVQCHESGSVFLANLPSAAMWEHVLREISTLRQSPKHFHASLQKARMENVYAPKLDWIRNALRLHGVRNPDLMEVVTPPSEFSQMLRTCDAIGAVRVVSEMGLATGAVHETGMDAAVLLESVDRVHDPVTLLRNVKSCVKPRGLVFLTALVASGFDLRVLRHRNAYLYPPDRTNCLSLQGLEQLLIHAGYRLVEVSTPGVLDLDVVRAHVQRDATIPVSSFESDLLAGNAETHHAFQNFLQQSHMSSFARIVATVE